MSRPRIAALRLTVSRTGGRREAKAFGRVIRVSRLPRMPSPERREQGAAAYHRHYCKKVYELYTIHRRIRWHDAKREEVFEQRGIDFAKLDELFCLPYLEDQRYDDPERYRVIGFVDGHLVTFIVEYRQDDLDEYIWVVTAWHATTQEEQAYEREISAS
jgi:uncharacterized DUF497 family protein